MLWSGASKSESENLGGNNIFENSEWENNFEVEKIVRKNSVILNHKYSDSIHIDPDYADTNQLIPDDSTNTGSINNSDEIFAIENMLSSRVPAPQTFFTYGTSSDPTSPSYDSSAEIVTPKVNPVPCNNPTNPVPNVPAYPDSDPSL